MHTFVWTAQYPTCMTDLQLAGNAKAALSHICSELFQLCQPVPEGRLGPIGCHVRWQFSTMLNSYWCLGPAIYVQFDRYTPASCFCKAL